MTHFDSTNAQSQHMDINFRRFETLLALGLFTLAFAYIYPELFFLNRSPMGGEPMTIKDPTVSWRTFIPSFREFRYQLLEHGNVLWSTLRGMGQPILGNTVQGAPIFPLNLVLLPLPDQLYWSVMPISRIILINLGGFLVARKVLGLSFAASILFALLIGFNTNTVRWINHPWSNGLLAGLWYFYFLCRLCFTQTPKHLTLSCVGLIVSVYAMVTTGFPEAAAMSALFIMFAFCGFLVSNWASIKPRLGKLASLMALAHIIGFALSSIQIFSLLEFIQVGGAMEQRDGYVSSSYQKEDLLPYTLAQLSIFGTSKEHQSLLTFSMGLWGLFFAVKGVVALVGGNIKRLSGKAYNTFAVSFALCMGLFVIKAFDLSDPISTLFLATPILAESHFPLYFSPLFYIGFAFFSALGLSDFLSFDKALKQDKITSFIGSLIAAVIVVFLSLMSLKYFHNTNPSQALSSLFNKPELSSLAIFLVASFFILTIQLAQNSRFTFTTHKPKLTWLLSSVIIVLCIAEIANTVPKQFFEKGFSSISVSPDTQRTIYHAIESAPLPRHELRGTNFYGDFVGQGLATVDNGASAILTPEYRILRRALFNVPYGGYLSLKNPYGAWSYHAMSANIISVHATAKSQPTWEANKRNPNINSKLTARPSEQQILRSPFFLKGRSQASIKNYSAASVWLHFKPIASTSGQNESHESFWIDTNIGSRRTLGEKDGRQIIDTSWRIRIPAEWLTHDKYNVAVRQMHPLTGEYDDAEPFVLSLDRKHREAVLGQDLKLLSSSQDSTRHLYFDSNALPRAYIASSCRQASTIEEVLAFYRNDNSVVKGEVLFPYNQEPTAVPCDSYNNTLKRVAIRKDDQTELSFEPIQGPALLILNDSYYPGWRAFDSNDGTKNQFKIERANTNGRSVYLPETRNYNISMSYTPFWLHWVYALLALAVMLFYGMMRMIWREENA